MSRIEKTKNSWSTAISSNNISTDDKKSEPLLTNNEEISSVENKLLLSSEKNKEENTNALLMEELKELTDNPTPFVSRQNTQSGTEVISINTRKNNTNEETDKVHITYEYNSQRREIIDASGIMVAERKVANTPHTKLREDDEEVVFNSICEAVCECESSVSDDISTINDVDDDDDDDDDTNNSHSNNKNMDVRNVDKEINRVNQVVHHAACTAASRLNLSGLQRENILLNVQNECIMHVHEHHKLRHLLYEEKEEEGMHCTCFALAAPWTVLSTPVKDANKTVLSKKKELMSEQEEKEFYKQQIDVENKSVYFAVGTEGGAIHLYNASFVEIGRCTWGTSSSSSSALSLLPSTLTRPWQQLMRGSLLRSKSNKANNKTKDNLKAVRCMSIPIDERVLVAAYANKSVILWSLQTHSPLKVIKDVFDCPLRLLYHLHPYSNRIMCCDDRGALHLFLYNIVLGKVMTKNTFLIAAGASCAVDVIPVWALSTKQEWELEEKIKDTSIVVDNINISGVNDDSQYISTKYYYGKSFNVSADANAGRQKEEELEWHVAPNRHIVATVHDCYLSLYHVHSGLNASMHKVAEYTHANDWKRPSQRHSTRDRHGNKTSSINENKSRHSQVQVQFVIQSPRISSLTESSSSLGSSNSKRKNNKNSKHNTKTDAERKGGGEEELKEEVELQQTKIPITLCAAWGNEVVLFDVNSRLTCKQCKAESGNDSVQLVPLISTGSIHLLAEPSYMMHAMCVISGTCLLVVMEQLSSTNNSNNSSTYGTVNDALIFLIDVSAGLIVERHHYNAKNVDLTSTNKKINDNLRSNNNNNKINDNLLQRCSNAEAKTSNSTIVVLANREVVMLSSPLHVWTCWVKPWNVRVERLIARQRFEEALELLQCVVEEVALAAVHVPASREELKRECSVLLKQIAMAYVESIVHTPNAEENFLYSETQMEMLQRVMRRILSVCVTVDLMDVYYNHIIPCLVEHHLTCEAYMVLEEFIITHVITSVPKEQLIILICWIAEKCQSKKNYFIFHNQDYTCLLNESQIQKRMERVLLNLSNDAITLIDVALQFQLVWVRITLMALRQDKIVHALRVALTHDEHMQNNAGTSQISKNDENNRFHLINCCNSCTKENSLALLSIKYISCVLLDKSFVEEEKEQIRLEQWERQVETEWIRSMTLQPDVRVRSKRELWSYLLSSYTTNTTNIKTNDVKNININISKSPLLRLFALHPSATVEILLQSLKDTTRYSPWNVQSSAKAYEVQIEGVTTLLEIVTDGVVNKSSLFNITSGTLNSEITNKIDSIVNETLQQLNFIPELLAHKASVPYCVIHKIIQAIVVLLLLEEELPEILECEREQQVQTTSCVSYVKKWNLLTELVVRDYTFTFDNLTTLRERKRLQWELNRFIHLLVSRQEISIMLYSYLLKVFTLKSMGICLAFLHCCMHKYVKAIDCILDARMCVIDESLHYDVFTILHEELERLQCRQGNTENNCVETTSTAQLSFASSSSGNTTRINNWWHAIIKRLPLLKATYANTFAIFVLQSIATLRYKSNTGTMPSLLVRDHTLFDYLHFLQQEIKHCQLENNSESADNNEQLLFELIHNEYIQNYYMALMAEYLPHQLYLHIQYLEECNVIYDRTLAMQNSLKHDIHDASILLLEKERKYDDSFALLERIITMLLEQLLNETTVKCGQGKECTNAVEYTKDNKDIQVKHTTAMLEFECVKELQHYIHVGVHLCESAIQNNTNNCRDVDNPITSISEIYSSKTEQLPSSGEYDNRKYSYWVKLLDCFIAPRHLLSARLHLLEPGQEVLSNTITHTLSQVNDNDQYEQQININNSMNISRKNDECCYDLDVYFAQPDCQSSEESNVNVSKESKVSCEYYQQEREEEELKLLTEPQLTRREDEHNDKGSIEMKSNDTVNNSTNYESNESMVLTNMIACCTHLFEYTIDCLLPFVDLPSLLLYLQDASVYEPLKFYKLALVKTLFALHHQISIQEMCCENTNETVDDITNKRLLLSGVNSGIVPLSDRCFLCHARLTDGACEELPKTIEMFMTTQRLVNHSGNEIYNNNISNDNNQMRKTHNTNTSICVFHCGHVYHEVCRVRMSSACGENRCIVCLLENEQKQHNHHRKEQIKLYNSLHWSQKIMKPYTTSNVKSNSNNNVVNVNNAENEEHDKAESKSEIKKRVLRRLRQVNTLLNETSDYYNILKGYIEPDDTVCSSFQTTQQHHNPTNSIDCNGKSTSNKTRKAALKSAVDDEQLLDLQIGELTNDEILQLFDA